MTIEKLKKGTEILDKIKLLEDEKAKWLKSNYIKEASIASTLEGRTLYCVLDVSFINFRRLKEDTLNIINTRIKKYQEEFDNL